MKKAIWGILILGLLFYGCGRKDKTIYGPDITPPEVKITNPKNGEVFYLIQDGFGEWVDTITVKCNITDYQSLVWIVNISIGELAIERYFKAAEVEVEELFQVTSEGERICTVRAYDRANNAGWDSVCVDVRKPE